MSHRYSGLVSICLAVLILPAGWVFAQDDEVPPPAVPAAPPASVPASAAKPAAKPAPKAKAESAAPTPGAPAPQVSRVLPDCQTYLASPLDGSVIQVDKKVYYVSPKLPSDKGSGTAYLVETDLDAGKSKRLAGYRGGKSATLLEHGRTLEAISIFDFSNEKPDCGEGKSTPIAIKWTEQKVLPSFPAGNYGYIEGESVGHLANLDSGLIQDIDLASKQKRTLESFTAGSRPLFLKASPPIALYSYSPKNRELSKFVNNEKTAEATLRLKEGMRVLQQGEQFGILQVKNDEKTLQVSQIKGWSGNEMKTFEINLPSGVAGASLAAHISFQSSQVLLFGKDETARRNLKQVLFYTGKDLTKTYKAPDGAFFSSARFGKERGIILLLSDLASNVVKELWWIEPGAEIKKIDAVKEKKAPALPVKH